MRYITVFSVLMVIAVSLLALQGQETDQDSLNVRQVYQRMEQDSTLILLDVRTEPEFSGELGHLPGAILIPLDELEARKAELEKYRENPIVVICRSGNRSGKATKLLRAEGYNAQNMTGGMRAWNKMLETMNKDTTGVRDEKNMEQ